METTVQYTPAQYSTGHTTVQYSAGPGTVQYLTPDLQSDKAVTDGFEQNYFIKRVLGKGGFGVVYTGQRIRDGLAVAIKEVPCSRVLEWSVLGGRSVPLELRLLYSAQTVPGVVRLIDYYDKGSTFLYVMEYSAHSRDLFDFISQRGPLAETVARQLFRQVLDTVLLCYQRGIVHRDIKDENLIIDTNTGELKLIDFGSGAFRREEPFTDFDGEYLLLQQILSTLLYLALCRHARVLPARVDYPEELLRGRADRLVAGNPPVRHGDRGHSLRERPGHLQRSPPLPRHPVHRVPGPHPGLPPGEQGDPGDQELVKVPV